MTFKEKIKKLRQTVPLTQAQVDELAKMPPKAYLSYYQQNKDPEVKEVPSRSHPTFQRAGDTMTRKSAAYLAGVSIAALDAYENRGNIPKQKTLVRLANVFGVSIDVLLDDSKSL